jgi:glycosyltransferase involved in cell wall biosynthesis
MRLSRRQWLKAFYLPLVPIEKRTLPQYPHIFAVNMQEKHNLEEAFPEVSVSFSPVGVDFDLFSPGDKQVSREHLGLDPEAKMVLFVGRLATEKGIDYLLEASVELTARFSQFRLYIVGTGPEEKALKQRVSNLGIQGHVHFVGYVSHLSLVDWYRATDIVCLPSVFEGFGLAAAEAMACGTPVVVARSAGTEAVVDIFESGILVSPRNPSVLSDALKKAFVHSVDSRPNIEKARSMLDWSVKLQHSFDLFETIV